MGNPPFEDVSPVKNGGFPASYVRLPEGTDDFFHQLRYNLGIRRLKLQGRRSRVRVVFGLHFLEKLTSWSENIMRSHPKTCLT